MASKHGKTGGLMALGWYSKHT